MHTKENDEKTKNLEKVTFLQDITQILNSRSGLNFARDNQSIIYFNDICNLIEIYIYARKEHPFTSYSRAPKT